MRGGAGSIGVLSVSDPGGRFGIGSEAMKTKRVSVIDSDLAKVGPALKRAADRAKRMAVQSGTPLYVWKAGRVADLNRPSVVAYAVRERKSRYRKSR